MMCCGDTITRASAKSRPCQQSVATYLALKGQIRFELQNNGRVLHAFDCANPRYMVHDQPVCGAHVLGAQQVDAEHLRWREWD
jgi:hypothetical protein